MEHTVEQVSGVGPITAKKLKGIGIQTVKQLAEASAGTLGMNNAQKLIDRAKLFLKCLEAEKEQSKICVTGSGIRLNSEKELVCKDSDKEEAFRYLIVDHSWYEMKVLVPQSTRNNDVYELHPAIIYELSIDPCERISLVCDWLIDDVQKHKEKSLTMTFSPQLLLFFNCDLPPLEVTITPSDFETLPSKHTLSNVLWEVNVIKQLFGNLPNQL